VAFRCALTHVEVIEEDDDLWVEQNGNPSRLSLSDYISKYHVRDWFPIPFPPPLPEEGRAE